MKLEAACMSWILQTARLQSRLPSDPYDRWVSPYGDCMAEFHRVDAGFLVRFPGQADFAISPSDTGSANNTWTITGHPTPECDAAVLTNLYHNAIEPLLGNHSGGLFLHGSAVVVSAEKNGTLGAIAFLGLSRGGKTTLAGSFAQAGFPFLTEDVIDLHLREGSYWLQPKRSKLRLFADSARFLLGDETEIADEDLKQDVEAGEVLPFSKAEAPLRQIYLLGTDHRAPISIRRLSHQESLSALMPHAFILDVTDKPRLRGHFGRMADLSQDTACYTLDFPRDYAELPRVKEAVLDQFSSLPL